MKEIINNSIKKLVIFALLLITILGVHTVSTAVNTSVAVSKTFNIGTMMPERNTDGPSGMFPQYYIKDAYRTVTHDPSRLDWTTNKWSATIGGKVVYCSAYGRYVRYGKYEQSDNLIYPGINNLQGSQYTVNGISSLSDAVNAEVEKYRTTVIEHIENQEIKYYKDDITTEANLIPASDSDSLKVKLEYTNDLYIDKNAIGFAYSGAMSESGFELDATRRGGASTNAQDKAIGIFGIIFDQLGGVHPGAYSSSIDNGTYKYEINNTNKNNYLIDGGGVIGPEVIVIENEEHNSGYKADNTSQTFTNNQKAFIFSAAENSYGDLEQKYTLNDIQGAYWRTLRQEGDIKPTEDTTDHITANADTLYQQSIKYMNFRNEIVSKGYENFVKFDISEHKVIADRENKKYIIGPISVKYPTIYDDTVVPIQYYEDFSYIKALMVKGENGKDLVYDEKNSDFEVVLQTKPGATNNNGLKKSYPKSDQKFYIIVSADKIGIDTKELKLNAKFEYITDTKATVETTLTADANIYRYYGYTSATDGATYAMKQGSAKITATYKMADNKTVKKHGSTCTFNQNGKCQHVHGGTCNYAFSGVCSKANCCYDDVQRKNITVPYTSYGIIVFQPYIKMGADRIRRADAQKLIVVNSAQRDYKCVQIEKDIPTIDLTMELGGHVWLDSDGGKEDISNGVKDYDDDEKTKLIEKMIPNVPVTLYRQDGVEIAKTKTLDKDKDINGDGKTTAPYEWVGSYYFKDLNPMYQYYVKFTYNGQYYQATTFKDSSNWNESNWPYTSNAKEIRDERTSYNAKFASIGASPKNYERVPGTGVYNETFTRRELLGETLQSNGTYKKTRTAVIDEYGNLILESSNDPTIQKMINYVKDCMIDSYTNADGAKGLYPVPSFFLIDNLPIDTNTYKTAFPDNAMPPLLYDKAYYINLGLDERQEADISLMKDVDSVRLEINGQGHDYKYKTRLDENKNKLPWDISVRLSDQYYKESYTRKLYNSDYEFKIDLYGDTDANNDGKTDKYGKAKSDELEVYVTYIIAVQNSSQSIQIKPDEIADYYDEDFEYIEERSHIDIVKYDNGKVREVLETRKVNAKPKTNYNVDNTIIQGYNNLYIDSLNNKYLEAGQRAEIFLTFKVKKDAQGFVKLDEKIANGEKIGVGKENIAEVMGYSTRYAPGTQVPNVGDVGLKTAGLVDIDSKPGNIKDTSIKKDNKDEVVYTRFEDDNDKSPNIVIKIDRDDDEGRLILGNVWEDSRDEYLESQETRTGDGERKDHENTLINGVTVQLVEIMDDGKTEYIWREFGDKGYTIDQFDKLPQEQKANGIGGKNTEGKGTGTGLNKSETPIINNYNIVKNYEFSNERKGDYVFKSFVPGKYIVRFKYGDTERTIVPSSFNIDLNSDGKAEGANAKSYNGQDYKSTTYQEGIDQSKSYVWRTESTWKDGKEILGKELRTISGYDKTKCNQNEKAQYLYDIAASDGKTNVSDAKDLESSRNTVNSYANGPITNYLAEVFASGRTDMEYENSINNRKQLLSDLMHKTAMTAETGLIVMEVEYNSLETDGTKGRTYKLKNVNLGLEERPKAQVMIDKQISNAKLTLANGSVLFDTNQTVTNVLWKDHKEYKVDYDRGIMKEDIFASIQNIREKNKNKYGLVQASLDEELMHGATIQLTYTITAINIGEVDYHDNAFYYTGKASNTNNVVKSNAIQVIDYVENNLEFTAAKNKNWKPIDINYIKSEGLVNEKLLEKLKGYNTIITTDKIDKELVPMLYKEKINSNTTDRSSIDLVLTKVVTPENKSDTLTYVNKVEIVKVSNTAGRRMEFSIVGNQDPTQEPQELDTDKAEVFKILPPFGNAGIYIIITITTILALGIIIAGTIFIKKKVLRK